MLGERLYSLKTRGRIELRPPVSFQPAIDGLGDTVASAQALAAKGKLQPILPV